MGKKPIIAPVTPAPTSTVYITQRANPSFRGVDHVYKSLADSALLADSELPYGPLVPDALDDGTIPADKLTTPLTVTAAKWGSTEEEDLIWLYVDGNIVGAPDGLPIADQPDPIVMTIPKADLDALGEGEHVISFSMGSGFGDSYVSQDLTILIDRTPPGGVTLPIIRFKLDFEQNGVTRAQIAADGDVLEGSIASYDGQKDGDLIRTYIQTQPDGVETPGPEIPVGNATDAHPVTFTLAQLEAAGATGNVHFWYVVTDKAGNAKTAEPATLRMLLVGSPDLLVAPRVPLFSDDNLIHEADARTPIAVEIPQFGFGAVGDVIWLLLGDLPPIEVAPPLSSVDLPVDPAKPDPVISTRTVNVPYAILVNVQPDDGAGGKQPIFTLDVRYEVRRGIFKVPSPALTVNVDLTLSGGGDPDPETPVNERLQATKVRHSGPGAIDNLIPIVFQPPVFATIPHLTAGAAPVEVFGANDLVQLYRFDADGVTEIAVGPETKAVPGADLTIDLPPAALLGGKWTFFYKVGRPLVPGPKVNWALSPSQVVVIEDASEQPGGPDLLPVAIFREAEIKQGFPAIGYTRASNGTIVRVYEYLNMKEGDTIDLTWQGNNKLRGDGTDIVAAKLPLSHVVVGADLEPKDDRLDDDPTRPPAPVMRVFVDFEIPYAEMQKITPLNKPDITAYGSAWVTYAVTAASGAANTSATDRTTFLPLVIDARPPKP